MLLRWRLWVFLGIASGMLANLQPASGGGSLWPPQTRCVRLGLDATPDPVRAANGGLYVDLPLLELGGPMDLGLRLHYDLNGSKSQFGLKDLPEWGKWGWSPMATCVPNELDGTNTVQFQLDGVGGVAFVQEAHGSWRLTERSDFGVDSSDSPVAFDMCWTNDWIYLADPRDEHVTCFEKADSDWRVRAVADRNGNALVYTYDTNVQDRLQPVRIEDLDGRSLDIAYTNFSSWESYLYSFTDHSGRQVRLIYEDGDDTPDNDLALRAAVDVTGGSNVFTFAYTNIGFGTASGLLTEHRRPRGNTPWTQGYYAFELYADDGYPHAAVTNQTDAYGHTTVFAYDTGAHTVTTAWPDGGTNTFLHAGRFGVPEQVTDAKGGATLFERNDANQLIAMTDADGERFAAQFDADHRRMKALTNASGKVLGITYMHPTQVITNPVAPSETVTFTFTQPAAIQYPDGTSESFAYDGRGNVTSSTDRAGAVTRIERNARGLVSRCINPNGTETHYAYDAMGRLTHVVDADGVAVSFALDALGRPTNRTDSAGVSVNWTWDAAGRLTRVTDGEGAKTVYGYDDNGNLAVVQHPDGSASGSALDLMDRAVQTTNVFGGVSVRTYDAMGRLAAETGADGVTVTNVYDCHGSLTHRVRAGVTVAFEYDGEGRVTSRQVNGGPRTVYVRSAEGRLSAITNALGQTVRFQRDAVGRLTNRIDAMGHAVAWEYTGGRRSKAVDEEGRTTVFTYDAVGRLASVTAPDSGQTSFGYTPGGRLSAQTNAMGRVRRYTYGAGGRLTAATAPDGARREWTYDVAGRIATASDPLTNTWGFSRDVAGRVTAVTNPLGGVSVTLYQSGGLAAATSDSDTGLWSNTWDSAGRRMAVMDPLGEITCYAYDGFNRLAAVTNPLGHAVRYEYDGHGWLVRTTDALGGETVRGYDAIGQVTSVTDRAGGINVMAYDAAGRLSRRTDPDGIETTYTRDASGRVLMRVTGGATWSNRYDAAGRQETVTTPSGRTETFCRDLLGRITNRVNAAGGCAFAAYDAAGRRVAATDEEGRTKRFAYDAAGRVTRVTLPDGNHAAFEHDALGGLTTLTDPGSNEWHRTFTAMGRRETEIDPLGRTNRFERDLAGRLRLKEFADGSTMELFRDAVGQVTGRVWSAGLSLSRTLDAKGRLTATEGLQVARDPVGRITNAWIHGETYAATWTPGGRLDSVAYASVVTVSYAYGSLDGRLQSVSDDLTGTTVTFEYDADGRRAAIRRPNGQDTTYTYDTAGRLERIEAEPGIILAYTRDRSGRILSESRTVPCMVSTQLTSRVDSHTFDAAAQLADSSAAYDACGRRTADARHAYARDAAGRVTAVDGVTNAYDGIGRLLERDGQAVACHPALPGAPLVDDGTNWYVWTPKGELLYMIPQGGTDAWHYRFDCGGNVIAVVGATGAVAEAYAYTPYGEQVGCIASALGNPFRFLGRYGIRAGGAQGDLYHVRSRWYDARTAAFLSPDPLWPQTGHPRALNPYVYARANPVNRLDIDGRLDKKTVNRWASGEDDEAHDFWGDPAPSRQQVMDRFAEMFGAWLASAAPGVDAAEEREEIERDMVERMAQQDGAGDGIPDAEPEAESAGQAHADATSDTALVRDIEAMYAEGSSAGIADNDLWEYEDEGGSFEGEASQEPEPQTGTWQRSDDGRSYREVAPAPRVEEKPKAPWECPKLPDGYFGWDRQQQGEWLFANNGLNYLNDAYKEASEKLKGLESYALVDLMRERLLVLDDIEDDYWGESMHAFFRQRLKELDADFEKVKREIQHAHRFIQRIQKRREQLRRNPPPKPAAKAVKQHVGEGRKRMTWWQIYQQMNRRKPHALQLKNDWSGSGSSLEMAPMKLRQNP